MFVAAIGVKSPLALHERRAPWSVFQDGTLSSGRTEARERTFVQTRGTAKIRGTTAGRATCKHRSGPGHTLLILAAPRGVSSAPRHYRATTPGLPCGRPRFHSSKPEKRVARADYRRGIHYTRIDGLLAALAGCFAHFPHGTCMLSGSRVEI